MVGIVGHQEVISQLHSYSLRSVQISILDVVEYTHQRVQKSNRTGEEEEVDDAQIIIMIIFVRSAVYTLWALEAINTHNPLYGSQRLVYAYYRDIDIHFSQHIFIYLFEKNSKKENGLEAVWEMEPPPPSLCNVVMKRDLCVKTFSKGKKCSQ